MAGTATISWINQFNPIDISGLKFWVDANDLSLANNDPVSTWSDKSGNANDATMTGSNRPTYVTNQINGLPAIQFDSANSQYMDLTAPILSTTDLTIFAVYKRGAGKISIISGITVDANAYPSQYEWTDSNTYFGFEGNDIKYGLTSGDSAFIYTSLRTTNGGATIELRRNGIDITLTTVAVATGTNSLQRIGKIGQYATYSDGYNAEILIYDRLLSTTERDTIEQYLGSKYNII